MSLFFLPEFFLSIFKVIHLLARLLTHSQSLTFLKQAESEGTFHSLFLSHFFYYFCLFVVVFRPLACHALTDWCPHTELAVSALCGMTWAWVRKWPIAFTDFASIWDDHYAQPDAGRAL